MKKLPIEFRMMMLGFAIAMAMLMTGCLGTAVFTPEATLMRAGIFNDTKVNNASLRWGNVKLDVGEYANKGDVASIDATGDAIMRGLVAYGTMGASEATRAIVMAALKGTSTNAVEAACSPDNPAACAPASTPFVKP
jgi:hypothetical protein